MWQKYEICNKPAFLLFSAWLHPEALKLKVIICFVVVVNIDKTTNEACR